MDAERNGRGGFDERPETELRQSVFPEDMMIDRTPVLKTIDKLYHDNGITDFMEAAYAYCAEHEQAIRQHIGEAENAS